MLLGIYVYNTHLHAGNMRNFSYFIFAMFVEPEVRLKESSSRIAAPYEVQRVQRASKPGNIKDRLLRHAVC